MARRARATALLVIDMINSFSSDGRGTVIRAALAAASGIARLRDRLPDMPVVYVNDNFMHWQADFREIVASCSRDGAAGAEVARRVEPRKGDYFVLKPKHSGFLDTPLEVLLGKMGVGRVVLTGVETDGCILATAIDAHMRELGLHVPPDCVAGRTAQRTRRALALMKSALGADVRSSRFVAA